MLRLDQATYDAIVAHAKRDHPDEACGIVAGPEGSDRAERLVEMVNAAGSPTFYEFDSTDLFQLYKEMDANDEEPVVVYHSHTATEAYPSRTDIGLAREPNAHYVLVSTREHGNNEGPVEFRSYRIVDGEVTEEAGRDRRAPTEHTRLQGVPPDGHRGPDPHHPAHLHRRREVRHRPRAPTCSALIDDLESKHPGIKDRLIDNGRPAPVRQRLRQRRGRALPRRPRGRRSATATRSSCCRPSPAAEPAWVARFVLVDGENIDATLGNHLYAAASAARGAAALGAGHRVRRAGVGPAGHRAVLPQRLARATLPTQFVQALLAMDYRADPAVGARRREGRRHRHPADPGRAARAATTTCCWSATTATSPRTSQRLRRAGRRVGVIALREYASNQLTADGVEIFDLEDDVAAFNVRLPRVRIIPLGEFDPEGFLA